jgi:hypothetical protein
MHHLREEKANSSSVLYSFCKARRLMVPENVQSLEILNNISHDDSALMLSDSLIPLTSRSGFLHTAFSSLSALGATVKHDTGNWDGM